MGRSSRADAASHRKEVIRAASQMIRERGSANVSVQDAMSAAGLTHGGFYKHFSSKDELMAAAARAAFSDVESTLDRIADETPHALTARDRIIDEYLTVEHRDSPAQGCANTALASDAARATDAALRQAYTNGLKQTISQLEAIDGGAHAHERALEELVVLVGGLTLARATSGDPISEELLAAAREQLKR